MAEIRVERLGAMKDRPAVERVRVFLGRTHLGELKIPHSQVDEFLRSSGATEIDNSGSPARPAAPAAEAAGDLMAALRASIEAARAGRGAVR